MAVCDSGPLVHLSRIGKIDLLRKLFGSVEIADTTYREVVEEGRTLGKAGVSAIEEAIEEGWVRLAKLETGDLRRAARLAGDESLDEGDAMPIILALRSRIPLITNDRLIVRSARSLGVECMWTTSLLIKAVEENTLTAKEALLILRKLVETGLHMRLEVYESLRTVIEELGR